MCFHIRDQIIMKPKYKFKYFVKIRLIKSVHVYFMTSIVFISLASFSFSMTANAAKLKWTSDL